MEKHFSVSVVDDVSILVRRIEEAAELYASQFKGVGQKEEPVESQEVFTIEDMGAAFKAGMAYDYYLGLKMHYASAKPFPRFKEWIKTRKP